MEKESFSQKIDRLFRENVSIQITKKETDEDIKIEAEINGNPVAAAFAMFQVAVRNKILFETLLYFIRKKTGNELKNESHD